MQKCAWIWLLWKSELETWLLVLAEVDLATFPLCMYTEVLVLANYVFNVSTIYC